VEANADKTRNVVETGIPNLVSNSRKPGAAAWYHLISWNGILFNLP